MERIGGKEMKILYVGPYRDGTGWAEAATRTILALDKAGAEVVPRQFSYNKKNEHVCPRIHELEKLSPVGADVVIQNVLPHNMEYVNGLFNIGYFMSETYSTKKANWEHNLQTMDAIMYPNKWSGSSCNHKSKIEFKIPAQEQEYYNRVWPKPIDCGDRYAFYFIGEFSARKNLTALLLAFHTEFDPHEPVELIIKTSVPNKTPKESHDLIKGYCDHIKKQLKLYKDLKYYKQETIITSRFTEAQMMGLHQACDCFCMLSHGEALCLPALDAECFGNALVVSDSDELDLSFGPNIFHVDGKMSPCTGALDTFDFLYSGHDEWFVPDIKAAKQAMRQAFELGKKKRNVEVPYFRKPAYTGKLLIKDIEQCLTSCSL